MKSPFDGYSSDNFNANDSGSKRNSGAVHIPEITLPKGGGALKGIDEKFEVNPANGTGSFSIPLPISMARNDYSPSLALSYNSGAGNGPFGLGWTIGIPAIVLKTDDGLPRYQGEDTYQISGADDLVPFLEETAPNVWEEQEKTTPNGYTVKRFRPRLEGSFSRLERIHHEDHGTYWKLTSAANVTTIYGRSESARMANPEDASQIFQWLAEFSFDDKGNWIKYVYKAEDLGNVPNAIFEESRLSGRAQFDNKYLKRVQYGNQKPYYIDHTKPYDPVDPTMVEGSGEEAHFFELVLDYGEHDELIPKTMESEDLSWSYRPDAFSSNRSGFEIRTNRLCRRVLMFHKFEELGETPCLVSSLQFKYEGSNINKAGGSEVSYLSSVERSGYIRLDDDSYSKKSTPAITFDYQELNWDTTIQMVNTENMMKAPIGLSKNYQWVDLFNEGISGILCEENGEWFYKENFGLEEGELKFSPGKQIRNRPTAMNDEKAFVSIVDVESSGAKDVEVILPGMHGFHSLDSDETKLVVENYKPFKQMPNIDMTSNSMRYLDVTGDGRPDLVITEDSVLVWYQNAGKDGYEEAEFVTKALDEISGAAVAFSDAEETIFLADFTGDGLTDISRIRNGEICYWANQGYGKFSAKISMGNAPNFDHPDLFNPALLQLADISGTGAVDIIYLGKNKFKAYINNNGNAWSDAHEIDPFPQVHNEGKLSVVDLLGTGTSCIVWSSQLATESPMRYIDLMSGKVPHVMTGYQNNSGKEVRFEYKSSTYFYLQDKRRGKPWATKLPFPLQVVSKVTREDKISNTIFTKTNSYHHGHYDYEEREFRGFARVESRDTEEFNEFKLTGAKNVVEEELHQPPVKTVTWFHTGNYIDRTKVLHQLDEEYFVNTDFAELEIQRNPIVDDDLSPEELQQAFRALKGAALRLEIYSEDDTNKSEYPYTSKTKSYSVKRLQPKGDNEYATFQILPSEQISYSYDRNPADPRIGHSFTLETDDLGNIVKHASVIYPRVSRPVGANSISDRVWDEQNKLHIVYGETDFTNDIELDHVFRLRAMSESRAYELSGISQPGDFFFNKSDLFDEIKTATTIHYEEDFTVGVQQRLSSHIRNYLLKDDLSGPLALGKLESLGLMYKSYKLAFTKGLVPKHYGTKVNDAMLMDAGYVHTEGDDHWWTQGGTVLYDANPEDNFYLPIGQEDVFGNSSEVTYDDYLLLAVSTTNALGHTISSEYDYRTLNAVLQTDINNNRTAVETDELGLVIKSAIMGKEGAGEGDTLENPTTRFEYELFNWQNNEKPNYVHNFVREEHGVSEPIWQESYAYFNGSGKVVMNKSQVEPGKAKKWNPATKTVDEVDADPRWIGNGRTIIDNKGKPIKSFEPYFSDTHEYENEDSLVETGVSSILYYDAAGRNVRIDHPNGTFTKTEFDVWFNKHYDSVDTVKDSQWYLDRGSPDPDVDPEPVDPEERAAWLAAKHYDTPLVRHTNSTGNLFNTIADTGGGSSIEAFVEYDLAKRYSKAYDPMDRLVSQGYTNLLKVPIYSKSAEKGERWVFLDVMGRPVKIWDNALFELRMTFDELHRPISSYVSQGGVETLYSHIVYGDILANPVAENLLGKPYKIFDQSGVITMSETDFKGNTTTVERTLCADYKTLIDWSVLDGLSDIADIDAAALPLLENETFTSSTSMDALNRPVLTTLPDGTVFRPTYNESNMLDMLEVQVRGVGAFETYMEEQDLNEKGQRECVKLGNGLISNYFYDPKTFRLVNLITKEDGGLDADAIQNLNYTFDPIGNVVHVVDDAQQTHYFKNAVVTPEHSFEYDAIYQLIKATGREHAVATQPSHSSIPNLSELPQDNIPSAVRNYTQTFEYDDLGNLLEMKHVATGGSWTRRYNYTYQSDPLDNTNRLSSTSLPGDPVGGPYSDTYTYDTRGNMTKMAHLNSLTWNFMDQLREVDLGGGGNAYYVYDSRGARIRKVIERIGGKRLERIYLGSVEIYREYQGINKRLERNTLHISDNAGRIAQVDTKLFDPDNTDPDNPLNVDLVRYQYDNHLKSASIETDETGEVISYEEYHPFGTSAYRNSKSGTNLSLKRYRFTGQERDDETGLYQMGMRYYAAWLGRWTSSDPAGFVDGFNLYRYSRNNPIRFSDPSGTDPDDNDDPMVQDVTTGELPQEVIDAKTDQENGAAVLNEYFPIGSIVEGTNGTYRITGGVRWVDGRYILTWEEIVGGEGDGGPGNSAEESTSTEEPSEDPPPEESSETAPSEEPGEGPGGGPGAGGESSEEPAHISEAAAVATHLGPAAERIIWHHRWGTFYRGWGGLNGNSQRGFILQNLYTNNPNIMQRDNVPQVDNISQNRVQQIKSTSSTRSSTIRSHASRGTRDPGAAIAADPNLTGRRPQAVIITPTDAPASVGTEITEGYNRIRRPVPNSLPPEHVRGIPGRAGMGTRALTGVGTLASGYALYGDIQRGDGWMAFGDGLGVVGGGLEVYAIAAPGATVAGASAMTVGLAVGGLGIAWTSGVSGVRAYQQGDTAGAVAGGVGVAAGLAITAGAVGIAAGVAAAPVVLAVGVIAAIGVGVFHAGRYFDWW